MLASLLVVSLFTATARAADGCVDCRVMDEAGWSLVDGALSGPEGSVRFSSGPLEAEYADSDGPVKVTADEAVDPVVQATAELRYDLGTRGLELVEDPEPTHRMITTPLGEGVVLIEYATQWRVGEGEVAPAEPPPTGGRMVRRCGGTALSFWQEGPGVTADLKVLTKASAQVLYAPSECSQYNAHEYERPQDAAPASDQEIKEAVEAVVEVKPVVEKDKGSWVPFLVAPAVLLVLAGVAVALQIKKAASRPKAPGRSGARRAAADVDESRGPKGVYTTANEGGVKVTMVGDSMESVDDAIAAAEAARRFGAGAGLGLAEGQGEVNPRLESAIRGLDRVIDPDWTGQPFYDAQDVPDPYAELLVIQDGGNWGGGWLRVFGMRPGPAPIARDVNILLGSKVGGRFVFGCSGFGAVLTLDSGGNVELCQPDGSPPVQLAPSLEAFFRELGRSPILRDDVCDRTALDKAVAQAEPLVPGQVYDPRNTLDRIELTELWADAPPVG